MAKCVNCGGRSLTLSQSGETRKCGDCGCANLVVCSEHIAAAAKFKRLMGTGYFATNVKETDRG